MTEYLVLCVAGESLANVPIENNGWIEVRRVEARSADAAIREVAGEFSPPVPQWVAVPSRSWKPVTVKVETKMALKFS